MRATGRGENATPEGHASQRLIASATGKCDAASKLVDNMDACEEVTKPIQSMGSLYMIDEAEMLFPIQKRTAALPVCDGKASPQGLDTFPESHPRAAVDAAPPQAHGGLGHKSARQHGAGAQESAGHSPPFCDLRLFQSGRELVDSSEQLLVE